MKYEKVEYVVNGKKISIKPKEFTGTKSPEVYSKQIMNALRQIGVDKEHIKIDVGGMRDTAYAEAKWEINKQIFRFRSDIFDSQYQNMGAICQAIQDDVRHITRGIKSLWASMRQYEALPSPEDISKSNPYMEFSSKEIKKLIMIHHPDTGEYNEKKYNQLREALEYKKKGEAYGDSSN